MNSNANIKHGFASSAVAFRDPADLKPHPNNARTHSKAQISALVASIRKFGFPNPILVDGDDCIIAGHGRVMAARQMGLEQVPTLCVDWLTEAEKRAYIIADNKLAELAGWNRELLSLELGTIAALDPDLDLSVTGFGVEDIDLLQDLGRKPKKTAVPEPEMPDPNAPIVTRLGDVWDAGSHRLLCGDARDRAAMRKLLGREKVDMVITDPPYNVKIEGHVSGLGKVKHREFEMASGEMSRAEFGRFLHESLVNMAWASRPGTLTYVFMDWRHISLLIEVGEAIFDQLVNLAVWVKSNGGMGSLYRSRHELVAIFRRAGRGHLNNVALGANGRNRTNVWQYAGANSFGADRDQALADHPTPKSIDMITDAILDVTRAGDLVLDSFAGSGTTLLAAQACNRRSRLIEFDPGYCDLILRRAMAAGLPVTLDGKSFEQVRAERQEEEA